MVGVEGRPAPEDEGGRVDRAVGSLVPPGVDAVGGRAMPWRHRDVRRREAELAAPAVADHDRTPHLVGAAEHRGRGLEVAPGQRLADGGRRDRRVRSPVVVTRPSGSTSKPWTAPISRSSATLPSTPVAEVEVLADDHASGRQAVDEHLLDELLRWLGRSALVEGEHDRVVDARRLDRAPAAARGR